MKRLNLRDIYPGTSDDSMIEIPDELSALLQQLERDSDAASRRIRYHNAYYTLDAADGIEHEVLFPTETPADIVERRFMYRLLYRGMAALPKKQSRRIYAYFFLNMKIDEIARAENVSAAGVSESIRKGLRRLAKFFQKNL